MILKYDETTLAYRCPECGQNILSMVGIFRLSGDMIRLKCSCGRSALELRYTKDKKVSLRVPCVFCGTDHTYTLAVSELFDRTVFSLPCPYTGMDTSFIGLKDDVLEALKKADEDFLALLKEAGFESFEKFRAGRDALTGTEDGDGEEEDEYEEEESLLDPAEVEDVIRFMVAELKDEGNLHCECADGEPEITCTMHGSEVTLTCKKCGSEVTVPIGTTGELNRFLHIERLDLEKIPVIDFDSMPTVEVPYYDENEDKDDGGDE